MIQEPETVSAAYSYGIAGFSGFTAWNLDSMAGGAESVTLITVCAIAVARLAYDLIRLYRYARGGKNDK